MSDAGIGMKKEFSDNFTKAMRMLLLHFYNAPTVLRDEILKEYLMNFVPDSELVWKNIQEKKSIEIYKEDCEGACQKSVERNFTSQKGSEYLLSIFMLVFCVGKDLQKLEIYSSEKLSELEIFSITINSYIASLIMDMDFDEKGSLDFESHYYPNTMFYEYIKNIKKTENFLKAVQKIEAYEINLDKKIVSLNQKLDKDILTTAYSFIEIQAILLLMEQSDVYSDAIHMIAKDILYVFKELLSNARIKKILIDPVISSNVVRSGFKMTTGIKIFFALENMDRFCLRIDFPHKGENYFHYNLHELGRKTGLPLKPCEYYKIVRKYGSKEDIFFKFGNLYWFRNDFVSKLNRTYSEEEYEEFREEMLRLFHKQSHYRMFTKSVTQEDMSQFLTEFSCALSHMQFYNFFYQDSSKGNIEEELIKIKLRDVLFDVLEIYQTISISKQICNITFQKSENTLKEKLLTTLFKYYKSFVEPLGTMEEFVEMNLPELLILLGELCEIEC